MTQKEQAAREQMKEWGKRGGRPATVPHNENWKGCRCRDCRREKAERRAAEIPASAIEVTERIKEEWIAREGEAVAPVVDREVAVKEVVPTDTSGTHEAAETSGVGEVVPAPEAVQPAVNPIVAALREKLGRAEAEDPEPAPAEEEFLWEPETGIREGEITIDAAAKRYKITARAIVSAAKAVNKRVSGLRYLENGDGVVGVGWIEAKKESEEGA